MRIMVMGAGGVGGYYGGRLAAAGHEVSMVARGAHLAAIQQNGLTVRSEYGSWHVPVQASADPADLPSPDVVLFCVKGYDTEDACRALVPVVRPDTMVISLQNGIDNETVMEQILPAGTTVGGSCRIISTIAAPGVIEQSGTNHRFDFGELDGSDSERTRAFLAVLAEAGLDAQRSLDIRRTLWEKFLGLDPVACISAAARCTIGEVFANPWTLAVQRAAMLEVVALAAAEGVDLGGEAAVERAIGFSTRQVAFDGTTSMYRDVVAGKRIEIDTLAGAAIRLGEKHGIPTPVHRFLYGVLAPAHLRAVKALETPPAG